MRSLVVAVASRPARGIGPGHRRSRRPGRVRPGAPSPSGPMYPRRPRGINALPWRNGHPTRAAGRPPGSAPPRPSGSIAADRHPGSVDRGEGPAAVGALKIGQPKSRNHRPAIALQKPKWLRSVSAHRAFASSWAVRLMSRSGMLPPDRRAWDPGEGRDRCAAGAPGRIPQLPTNEHVAQDQMASLRAGTWGRGGAPSPSRPVGEVAPAHPPRWGVGSGPGGDRCAPEGSRPNHSKHSARTGCRTRNGFAPRRHDQAEDGPPRSSSRPPGEGSPPRCRRPPGRDGACASGPATGRGRRGRVGRGAVVRESARRSAPGRLCAGRDGGAERPTPPLYDRGEGRFQSHNPAKAELPGAQ